MRRLAFALLLACSASFLCLAAEDAAQPDATPTPDAAKAESTKPEPQTRQAKEAALKADIAKLIQTAQQQMAELETQLRNHQSNAAGTTSVAVSATLDRLMILGATGHTNPQVKALSSRYARLAKQVLNQMAAKADQIQQQSDAQKQ